MKRWETERTVGCTSASEKATWPHSAMLALLAVGHSFREVVECGSPMPLSRIYCGTVNGERLALDLELGDSLGFGAWGLDLSHSLLTGYLSPASQLLTPIHRLPITCHQPEPTPPISTNLIPMDG